MLNPDRGYLNIRKVWGTYTQADPPKSIPHMLQSAGMEFEGKLHSRLDDCFNLARFIIHCNLAGIELTDGSSVLNPPHNTVPELRVDPITLEPQNSQ